MFEIVLLLSLQSLDKRDDDVRAQYGPVRIRIATDGNKIGRQQKVADTCKPEQAIGDPRPRITAMIARDRLVQRQWMRQKEAQGRGVRRYFDLDQHLGRSLYVGSLPRSSASVRPKAIF